MVGEVDGGGVPSPSAVPLHCLVQASPGDAVEVVRGHVSTQKHRRWPVRRVVCAAIIGVPTEAIICRGEEGPGGGLGVGGGGYPFGAMRSPTLIRDDRAGHENRAGKKVNVEVM